MRTITGVLLTCLTLFLAPDLVSQTGWSVDRYEGFRASINNQNAVSQLGWTTGNLGNSWDEGEWVPYRLTLQNVNVAGTTNLTFSDIVVCYDFTVSGARFVDLVRGIQVGSVATGDGWPQANGAAYPLTTVAQLNTAQNNQAQYTWTGYSLLNLPNAQVHRASGAGYPIGTPTDGERCFIIKRQDLVNAGFTGTYTTLIIYFNLHLAQTFVWSLSLQSQLNSAPTAGWGGYLYGAAPFSNDSRNGSGYVPGASGHTYLTQGNRNVSIPVPPAPLGEISGLKFYDSNANGVRDGGEPVLENWPIYISTIIGGNPVSYTELTDNAGLYSLTGLPGAVYTVSEQYQGPKPLASPPPNYPYAAFAQTPPSTWDESYPPIPTTVGLATAVSTSAAGLALGYAPESWSVDLTGTTTVQGNVNFGNFIPPPQCAVTPATLTACVGDLVTFTAARVAEGMPPYTVAWTGPNNFSASTFAISVTAGPLTAGVYTAILTDANGLQSVGCTGTLSLYPVPACAITGGPMAVCAFSTGHQYNGPLFDTPPVNITNWDWTISGNGTIVSPANFQTINVNAGGAGTYTLVLTTTSTDGCTSTCSTTVTVNPLPSCMIGNTDPVCPGARTIHTGPPNMALYQWTIIGSGTIFATSGNTVTIDAANTNNTSYTVQLTVTDANGCTSFCDAQVLVQDNTPPNIGCAIDQTINCPAPTALPFIPPIVSDNCDPNPVVVVVGTVTVPGNCPQQYDVVRTWRATDAWGNSAVCSQTIHVVDVTPPVITVPPAPLTMQCYSTSAVASWAATASAIDLCSGAVTTVPTWTPPTSNCNQTVTVTFTATDQCGNSSTATKTFTVNDTTPPVITVPQANLSMECYNAGLVSTWAATASATDNCLGPVILVPTWTAPVDNCNRTVTVTFTATDVCGNSSTATKTFLVNDTTPPVITVPPATLTMQCYSAGAVATWAATASATDNCNGPVTLVPTWTAPVDNCNRIVTVTFTATDGCGNSSTATKTFLVNDNTPPVITCPAPVTVLCAALVPAVNITAVTATDNCGTATVVHVGDVISNQTCANRYTITRTYKATDACLNSSICTQIITVNDNVPPVIVVPPTTLTMQCYSASAVATWAATATATDNCIGTVTLVPTWTAPVDNCNRTVTVTFTATDVCGNSSTATKTFLVNDNTPPMITCPGPVTVVCAANVPAPNISTVTASDNCGTPTVVFVNDVITNQVCANKYTITRTYKATDACLNSSICTQIITVNDNVPPVITVPPTSLTMQCYSPSAVATWAATASATDNCIGIVTLVPTWTAPNGNCNQTVTVTFTATDVCGNSSTATKTFLVNDTTPPVITVPPATLTMQCYSAGAVATWAATASATDNCLGNVALVPTWTAPVDNCNRTVTVTFTATDVCGNSSTATKTFLVNDNTPPVITCPAPVTVLCAALVPTPNITTVTATDNCGTPTVVHVGDVISNQTCANRYTIARTYKATDACLNSSICTQIITVNDNVPPVIVVPPTTLTMQCYSASAVATWAATASATDNCIGTVTLVPTWTAPVDNCNRTVTVTFTATDVCGNSSTATKTFLVNDNTPPMITCPGPVTVVCAANVPAPNISTVTASDNCGTPTVVFVNDVISNQVCANKYTITRTYKATDACLNSSTCTQIITVNDNVAPVITVPSTTLTMQCYSASAVATWAATASATDNCIGIVTLVPTWTPPVDNCNRTVTVTFTATDVCGNSSTATKTFLVNDTTPPTITCPAPVTVQCAADVPAANTALVISTDNCGGPVVKTHVGDVISNQTCANRYTVTRTYRSTDGCGNSATCTQIITVNDNTAPVITVPQAPLAMQCYSSSAVDTWAATASATDNCIGIVTLVPTWTAPVDNCNRTVTVTFTATDVCGNSSTATATFLVNDTTPPLISGVGGPATIECPATPVFSTPTATDNCTPPPTLTFTDATTPGNCPANYSTTRTWTATDNCGNTSTASQTITVEDTTPPTFDFIPANSVIQCDQQVVFAVPTAIDACGTATVSSFGQDLVVQGSCPNEYSVSRTWIATDACGNTSALITVTIDVVDDTPPVLVPAAPKQVVCASIWTYDDPTVTDNCDLNPVVTIVSTTTVMLPSGEKEHTRTWVATDACGNTSLQVSQVVTEGRCQYFTLTQGAFGNNGGSWCGVGHPRRLAHIQQLLGSGDIVMGLPGQSLTITLADAQCVIDKLPGGGPASVLPVGNATFNANCSTTIPYQLQGQRFRNQLLAQGITFALNMRIDPGLAAFYLPDPSTPWMRTEDPNYVNGTCGDGDDVGYGTFSVHFIPPSVLTYLGSNGSNVTVGQLLVLANTALGGGNTGNVSLTDIAAALDAYNKGFDEGRFFAGYHAVPPPKAGIAEAIPSDFQLFQNHPNPFNPSTTIEYEVPVNSTVYLAVYNSLGNLVAMLIDGEVREGRHSIMWNSRANGVDLPSGIYTYRLMATGEDGRKFSSVKTMMLVK